MEIVTEKWLFSDVTEQFDFFLELWVEFGNIEGSIGVEVRVSWLGLFLGREFKITGKDTFTCVTETVDSISNEGKLLLLVI